MNLFVTMLTFATQTPRLDLTLHTPSDLVAGLPLVVDGILKNENDSSIFIDLGTNRSGWLKVKMIDHAGRTITESHPDVPIPIVNREHAFSLGPMIEPKGKRELRLSLRMDTSGLASGSYTIACEVNLHFAENGLGLLDRNGRKPSRFHLAKEFPVIVRNDAAKVEAYADGLLDAYLASSGFNAVETARQLMLIDHKVVLPRVGKVSPAKWTDDQLSFLLRETAPCATLEEARWVAKIVRPGVRSWARGAIGLMKRSESPGVAEIGNDIERRLGATNP